MKHLKVLFAGIIAAIALIAAAPAANAQKLSGAELKMAVAELNKQLPMEIAEGATMTKITLNDKATLLTITFTFNPQKMGVTLAEAKSEVAEMTSRDMRALIGDDFDMFQGMFDCDVDIVIAFPDKTSQTFHL